MTWEEALDALGATGEWEPPADLGPLPAALAARAQETLARLTEQIQTLETQQAEVARELTALSTAGSSEPSTPHFIDTTA